MTLHKKEFLKIFIVVSVTLGEFSRANVWQQPRSPRPPFACCHTAAGGDNVTTGTVRRPSKITISR